MARTLQQLNQYLAGHWKFQNNFKDSSGNGNHGTPTDIEWKPTRRGLKPSFNGSSSYVDLTGGSFPTGNSPRTVSGWFTAEEGNVQTFFDYGTDLTGQRFSITASKTTVAVAFSGHNWGISTLNLTGWHFITVIFPSGTTQSDQAKIFVDGVEQTLSTLAGTPQHVNTGDTYAYIGRGTGNYNYGKLDDVRIYNTDLTSDEVLNLYNATKHEYGIIPAERNYRPTISIKPENGLVLGFDGRTRNADGTFRDMSGNSNHGTDYDTSRAMSPFGEVRRFNGVNNYIDAGNDASLKIAETFAIELWIKPDDVISDQYILQKGLDNYGIILGYQENNVNFYNASYQPDATSTQMPVTQKTWNHIIYTKDSNGLSNNWRGYINGVEQFVLNQDFTNATTASSLLIGKHINNVDYYKGLNVLVRIYNRALSESEIKAKFNQYAQQVLYKVNFTDYPDNEDVSYTTNIPYLNTNISSGTFKIDNDQLTCTSAGTIKFRSIHEFDGSELIRIKINGTEYTGTGSVTQGTVTVSISQGSNLVTVNMGIGDVLDEIKIQFRAEVS